VVDTWTSDAKEAHVIKRLVVGETYTLREEFAPYGYLKAADIQFTVEDTGKVQHVEMKDDVTLRYDDNAPDVVVATLKLVNVPTEPKLPQTGDNANPLLYLGIGALALITGVGVGLRGRKKKNKQ